VSNLWLFIHWFVYAGTDDVDENDGESEAEAASRKRPRLNSSDNTVEPLPSLQVVADAFFSIIPQVLRLVLTFSFAQMLKH